MSKYKLSARKGLKTWRLNQLEKADINQVIKLSEQIIEAEQMLEDDNSREGWIFRTIGKTTWKSFLRFGDRNKSCVKLRLNWIDNKARELDLYSLELERNFNINIVPDEFAEFMTTYPSGRNEYPPMARLIELHRIFKQVAGFNYNHKFIMKEVLTRDFILSIIPDAPF